MRQLLQDDGQTGNIGRLIGRSIVRWPNISSDLAHRLASSFQRFGGLARWTRVSDSLGLARDKLFDSVAAPTFAKQHSAQGDNR